MGIVIQVLDRGQIIDIYNFAMNTNFFYSSDNFQTSDFLDWLANGVNHSHPDFGGPGCYTFRSSRQWVAETMGALVLTLPLTVWALKHSGNTSSGEKHLQASSEQNVVAKIPSGWRQAGLVAHTLIFGLAIGHKFSTRTLIYLLQPCHMVTAIQVYLLAAPASSTTFTMFRTHLGLLNGAVLALLFPVTDAYKLPGEYSLYWIQHVAMLLVPFLLNAQATHTPHHQEAQCHGLFSPIAPSSSSTSLFFNLWPWLFMSTWTLCFVRLRVILSMDLTTYCTMSGARQ